jgi:4-hydroxybenzoate polyprenyltransferase
MVGVGQLQKLGVFYYLGLGVVFGLIMYQYYLIRNREPARCFKAFLHNNWVGATVFTGIALDYFINTTF